MDLLCLVSLKNGIGFHLEALSRSSPQYSMVENKKWFSYETSHKRSVTKGETSMSHNRWRNQRYIPLFIWNPSLSKTIKNSPLNGIEGSFCEKWMTHLHPRHSQLDWQLKTPAAAEDFEIALPKLNHWTLNACHEKLADLGRKTKQQLVNSKMAFTCRHVGTYWDSEGSWLKQGYRKNVFITLLIRARNKN